MRFTPLTPARLVDALADWVLNRAEPAGPAGIVIGFDGPAEIGTTDLADDVAQALRGSGRQIIRAGTAWWWRPSALRLELGRRDVDMLLNGWVDADALRRELIDPVHGGTAGFITKLRDPETDRSVRQQSEPVAPGAILLLDGPFLLAAELPLDAVVALAVSPAGLERTLPDERSWWSAGFESYRHGYPLPDRADVVLSYDHRSTPAAAGLEVTRHR